VCLVSNHRETDKLFVELGIYSWRFNLLGISRFWL